MKKILKLSTCILTILSLTLLVGCTEFDASVLSSDDYDIDVYGLDQDAMYNRLVIAGDHVSELLGSTIRVEGQYGCSYATLNDQPIVYHYILVDDSDGCSTGFFEFKWDNHKLIDYPVEGEYICITGVLDQYYEETDAPYDFIRADNVEVIRSYEDSENEKQKLREQIIERENNEK